MLHDSPEDENIGQQVVGEQPPTSFSVSAQSLFNDGGATTLTFATNMKINIPMLFLLAMPTAGFTAEEAQPRFYHVAEFLTWADKKLAADDYEALIKAQADAKDTQPTRLAYVKKLDSDLGEAKLAKVFEGREFPKDATTFKLGGCCMELKHCHIDFEKEGKSWKITRIWQCR